MEMRKSKKPLIVTIIVAIVAIVGVIGVSRAFFNYTRTGSQNLVQVGRIAFSTNQTRTISLSNVFPIDSADVATDEDNVGTFTVSVTGDTDYSGGLEYLVSAANAHVTTSTGKTVPLSIQVTATNLGTSNANYFSDRDEATTNIYKKLVGDTLVGNQMLLVGYITPNNPTGTAAGVNGTITIKAYFDEAKVKISDTYNPDDPSTIPSRWTGDYTVLTTTEWNNLVSSGISFQVKVEANEGIWVKGSLDEIMRMENKDATTGDSTLDTSIDFGAISSDANGKGVYMRAGTQDEPYPIVYYRGEVDNNNVVFANKCWKAVRTTDTGGVKLIYNGELSALNVPLAEADYNILTNTGSMTFDTSENVWVVHSTTSIGSSSEPKEISFSVPNGDGYLLEVYGNAGSSISGGMYRWVTDSYQQRNGFGGGGGQPLTASLTNFGTLTTEEPIKVTYYGTGTSEQELVLKIRVIHPDESLGLGCDNKGTAAQMTLNNTSSFAFSGTSLYQSLAYNGYMRGTVYEQKSGSKSGTYWSDVDYNGTIYTLKTGGTTSASLNSNHHYICEDASNCTKVRYYYVSISSSYKYYIELENGDTIETALAKMQTNTTDSNAKANIDEWFRINLTNLDSDEITILPNKTDYREYLEDTIWCNDRSFGSGSNNGYMVNGDLGSNVYYGAYQRSNSATNASTEKNQPTLSCPNKNDAFTVKNDKGNKALKYPVAMLTADEIVFAGATTSGTSKFYLNIGRYSTWTLSPSWVATNNGGGHASGFGLYGGYLNDSYNGVNSAYGLRPAVSLKPGTPIARGEGTAISPYIIE